MKQILNKLKENTKLLIPITSILLLIVLCIGTTFAVFNYSNDNAENNDINSGHISMSYTEPSNEYIVENALPMKDAEGMNSTNYFEFSVTTTAPTNDADDEGVSIPYEISITESEGNTLTNDKIKMYLSEVEGDTENTHTVPTLVSYFEPSLYKEGQIKVGFNLHLHRNDNETVTTKYRLRAWIDNDVDVSDWDTANKYQYKFRVNVNGEATYQGYETELSCFAYEENDRGNYSITGYDFNKCGEKNIVIPTHTNISKVVLYKEILSVSWMSNDKFLELNKEMMLSDGFCDDYGTVDSEDDWTKCLALKGLDKDEFEAEGISGFESKKDELTFLYDWVGDNYYDHLYEIENYQLEEIINMGVLTIETGPEEERTIKIKIDEIKSFGDVKATQVSNSKYNMRTNNLDNIVPFDKQQLLAVTDTKPVVNVIVVPENIEIAKDAFLSVKINKLLEDNGNFPTSCFEYQNIDDALEIKRYKCQGVIDVIIPYEIDEKQVTQIVEEAFYEVGLEKVHFPKGILKIRSRAFAGNNLKVIDLPESLIEIHSSAFARNNLSEVKIPKNIKHASGFSHNKITQLIIPEGVTSIADFSANKLTDLVLPNSLIEIRDAAFSNNELTKIKIPESVTSIGGYAFKGNKLTSVEIPNNVTYLAGFNDNNITSIKIPESVTSIGGYAFENNMIKEINIPNNVKKIDAFAFANNDLRNVVVGKGVTSIELNTFAYNPNLFKIINKSTTPLRWHWALNATGDNITMVTGVVGNVEIVAE